MDQREAQQNSDKARAELRAMPQTRDAVLRLLLIEAGLTFDTTFCGPGEYGQLCKTANVEANLGRKPEHALARVIAKHLRIGK